MTKIEAAGSSGRDLDLVLFGATGVTGRLVAEHLARRRPGLRWALAGRDRDKLAALRDALVAIDPEAHALPLIVADCLDRDAVDAIVRRARVVCTTVGPFARYGAALVAACAARGTHYCDITGEPTFVRAMIDAHHERAEASGARIVHCCGFDSIPSDLGVFALHEHLAARGDRLVEARYRVVRLRGRASAGTAATMIDLFAQSTDPDTRAMLDDPYAFYPRGAARGPEQRDQLGPRFDPSTRRWTAPFIMAPINSRVVRRSNALLDFAYGRGFRYDEALDMGAGYTGFVRAAAVSSALAGIYTAAAIAPTRALLSRMLPALGDGDDARRDGFFRVEIRALSVQGERVRVVVEADGDPGYDETAKMLAESALCLAEDELPSRAGVLTPAAAMGTRLLERLRAVGITFRVEVPRETS